MTPARVPARAPFDPRVQAGAPVPVAEDHENCARCGVFDAPFRVPDRSKKDRPLCGLCCDEVLGLLPPQSARWQRWLEQQGRAV